MQAPLARHDELLRRAVEHGGGHVFSTGGDGLAAVFGRASDAVAAAVTAQTALTNEPWPESVTLRVRMGVHTGEVQEWDGDYFGPAVNRAARLMGGGRRRAGLGVAGDRRSSTRSTRRRRDVRGSRRTGPSVVGAARACVSGHLARRPLARERAYGRAPGTRAGQSSEDRNGAARSRP